MSMTYFSSPFWLLNDFVTIWKLYIIIRVIGSDSITCYKILPCYLLPHKVVYFFRTSLFQQPIFKGHITHSDVSIYFPVVRCAFSKAKLYGSYKVVVVTLIAGTKNGSHKKHAVVVTKPYFLLLNSLIVLWGKEADLRKVVVHKCEYSM